MADAGEQHWRDAWSEAKAHPDADGPRRKAMQAAFEAVRPLRGRSDEEVRTALIAQAACRGIGDVSGQELGVLVKALNASPTRVAFDVLGKQATVIRGLWAQVKKHATPGWTNAPAAASTYNWSDDQDVHRALVKLDAAAGPTVALLFTEVPVAWGSEDEETPCRGFDAWVTDGATGRLDGTVTVHVGKHVIGVLDAKDSRLVREILREQRTKSMRFDAAAWGDDPATGWITLGLPDRR